MCIYCISSTLYKHCINTKLTCPILLWYNTYFGRACVILQSAHASREHAHTKITLCCSCLTPSSYCAPVSSQHSLSISASTAPSAAFSWALSDTKAEVTWHFCVLESHLCWSLSLTTSCLCWQTSAGTFSLAFMATVWFVGFHVQPLGWVKLTLCSVLPTATAAFYVFPISCSGRRAWWQSFLCKLRRKDYFCSWFDVGFYFRFDMFFLSLHWSNRVHNYAPIKAWRSNYYSCDCTNGNAVHHMLLNRSCVPQ